MSLWISCTIDDSMLRELLDQVQQIDQLLLNGNLSYFNLDYLLNLKSLSIAGTISESFNFELFKNLCNRLEDINIELTNVDDRKFSKLFDGHQFSKLVNFSMRNYNITRLKKEFINRFPLLDQLFLAECNIEEIEFDAFSNCKKLRRLDLSQNRIKSIAKETFSNLRKLEIIDLSSNELTKVDATYIGVSRFMVEILLKNYNYATFNYYWFRH